MQTEVYALRKQPGAAAPPAAATNPKQLASLQVALPSSSRELQPADCWTDLPMDLFYTPKALHVEGKLLTLVALKRCDL